MQISEVAKAIVAGLAAAVSYFTSVIIGNDPTSGFADLTTVQWLGVIPVVVATYGITWVVPNKELESDSE